MADRKSNYEYDMEAGRKFCKGCLTWRPVDQFRFELRNNKPTLSYHCKACIRANNAKLRAKNPEKYNAYQRAWAARESSEGLNNNRVAKLRRKYNLSPAEYSALLEKQNGRCGICECEFDADNPLRVDHDHKTHEVRGLLCHNCNAGIGHFRDMTVYLERAIEYISRADHEDRSN